MSSMKRTNPAAKIIFQTAASYRLLSLGVLLTVIGSVIISLLPPLLLARIIDRLTSGHAPAITMIAGYFALIALTGLLEAARESLLIVFGQKITHTLRSRLCSKLTFLTADSLNKQEPGALVSRFVGDAGTVENLFTSGLISMAADVCKIISILVIIRVKNPGLALLLLCLLPFLFGFTRHVQKKTLAAQLANRAAVSKVTNHVPESIRCIRTIHTLGKEAYMEDTYDAYISESYAAIEKNNFYDAIYSPIILILNAVLVAIVMLLSASGNASLLAFFGMSVGTSVAIINYIAQIFSPLESLGMEIQTIQSAIAGVKRINAFLSEPERTIPIGSAALAHTHCIELQHVTFGYDEHVVLSDISFSVDAGEQATLAGRTGIGKSTIFKLLLGLYAPQSGAVLIDGIPAASIPDTEKRQLFGYVAQNFQPVPGSVLMQITLSDTGLSQDMAEHAAKLVGLHDTICALPQGYDTLCTPELFSQGQWQLLSIARAIAANPKILLLDEITANLDAETEQTVLTALKHAAASRTVLSISHRIYEKNGGRIIRL